MSVKTSENESVSCSVMSNSLGPHGLWPRRLLCPWNSGIHGILEWPTQGSNLGLSHCRQIHYRLSQQRSPKNTEVGSHSLLQGIFPTQGQNPGLRNVRTFLQTQECFSLNTIAYLSWQKNTFISLTTEGKCEILLFGYFKNWVG